MQTHTDPPHPDAALFAVRQASPSSSVTMTFEGRSITAPEGISVAAALLINGVTSFRTTPTQSTARAPYCMMGICFDCLLEVDGLPNRQSCLMSVREGMVIGRQQGASDLSAAAGQTRQGDGRGC